MMNKKMKKIEYQFFIRVINNDVSPDEKKYFEDWLLQSTKNRSDYRSFVTLWEGLTPPQNMLPPDSHDQWEKISAHVHAEMNKTRNSEKHFQPDRSPKHERMNPHKITRFFFEQRFLSAAIVVILLASGWLVSNFDHLLNHSTPVSEISMLQKTVEIKTQNGEKKSLMLRDGSRIHLNSSSKLTLPDDFDAAERSIEVEGEAYLSVTHNNSKPFKVKCGNTVTIVRGTEFNIKNRGTTVSVVVVKGIVETYDIASSKKIRLKKGEAGSYDNVNGLSVPKKADIRYALAWRNDKLSFSHTSLKEVMDEIERFYNVKVIFQEESLKEKTITGYFNTDSMTNLLSIISITLDISISYSNGVVTVNERPQRTKTIKG